MKEFVVLVLPAAVAISAGYPAYGSKLRLASEEPEATLGVRPNWKLTPRATNLSRDR